MNKNKKGMTLIEVLVAAVLTSIVGAGIVGLYFILGQNQTLVFEDYLNIDQANSNVTQFVRELRTSRSGEEGSYPIELAQDQEISFYSDIDKDGLSEKVRYYLVGTNFYKAVTEPSTFPVSYPQSNERVILLTDQVRNGSEPVFYYYNGDWPEDTTNNPLSFPRSISEIKLVKIYIRINTRENEAENDYILESYSQLRVLKENL